jgi:membrane protein involved in colicin uptake
VAAIGADETGDRDARDLRRDGARKTFATVAEGKDRAADEEQHSKEGDDAPEAELAANAPTVDDLIGCHGHGEASHPVAGTAAIAASRHPLAVILANWQAAADIPVAGVPSGGQVGR